MALSFKDKYALSLEGTDFFHRVAAACGKYAAYCAGLGNGASSIQSSFVGRVLPGSNVDVEASYIMWAVLGDATVTASTLTGTDSDIDDATLNPIVETQLHALGRA